MPPGQGPQQQSPIRLPTTPAQSAPGPQYNAQAQPMPSSMQSSAYVPTQPMQQQANQQQSIEQQALAGGSNAQQTQNFLRALTAAGAGNNNNFMQSAAPAAQSAAPLLGPLSGYGGGGPRVSYDPALGARENNGGATYPLLNGAGNAPPPKPLPGSPGGPPIDFSNMLNPAVPPPDPRNNFAQGSTPQMGNSFQRPANDPFNIGGMNFPGLSAPPPPPDPRNNLLASGGMQLVSDERAKTSIEPAERDVRAMLGELGVHSYRYKDPADGAGRYVSPMAQELEKTPIGKSAVIETPRGKMVDYGRLGGITLAAAALHEKRIAEIEKALRLKGGSRG